MAVVRTAYPALATARLRLRQFRLDDTDAMHECYGSAEAMQYWNRPAHARRIETERAVRRSIVFRPAKRVVWAVADAGTDRCLGMVNYHNCDLRYRSADIGYMINPAHQRQGIAGEAVGALIGHCFDVLKLHRLTAFIDTDNIASQALAEKFGFRREGLLRETIFLGGAWRSDYVYGLLEGEHELARRTTTK